MSIHEARINILKPYAHASLTDEDIVLTARVKQSLAKGGPLDFHTARALFARRQDIAITENLRGLVLRPLVERYGIDEQGMLNMQNSIAQCIELENKDVDPDIAIAEYYSNIWKDRIDIRLQEAIPYTYLFPHFIRDNIVAVIRLKITDTRLDLNHDYPNGRKDNETRRDLLAQLQGFTMNQFTFAHTEHATRQRMLFAFMEMDTAKQLAANLELAPYIHEQLRSARSGVWETPLVLQSILTKKTQPQE